MKINDLVKIKEGTVPPWKPSTITMSQIGIVMDCLEMEDGFFEYEVIFDNGEIGWFSDLRLEVISDKNRRSS